MKALVIAAVVLTVWTGTAFSKSKKRDAKQSISFKDEKGSLIIENQLNTDAVIFADRPERQIILGGIKAGSSRSFDLRKLPDNHERGTFFIRAANYEAVRRKTHITAEDVIYTALVTYDLTYENDVSRIIIPSVIDASQQFCVYASNETEDFILELRINDPVQGECIAALPPLSKNNRIYLSPRDDELAYTFYPIFVFVNPKTGERTSTHANKLDRRRVLPVEVGSEEYPVRFSTSFRVNIGYDAAFVRLQNDTNIGVVFHNAARSLKNQRELRFTSSGTTDIYEIQSSDDREGQLYTALGFEFDDFRRITMSPYKFKAGYKYDVIITQLNGNYQYDIRETGQKSLDEYGMMELLFE